jgi:hypothetical protein
VFSLFRRQRPRTWQGQLRSVTTIEPGDRIGHDAEEVISVKEHINDVIRVQLAGRVTMIYLATEQTLVFKEMK